jgi:hypothetical protein
MMTMRIIDQGHRLGREGGTKLLLNLIGYGHISDQRSIVTPLSRLYQCLHATILAA